MRLTAPFVIAGLAVVAAPAVAQDNEPRVVVRDVVHTARAGAYQGRNNGPEQTERFSRKVKIGRDGRFTLSNISGDIVVTAGGGDEVSIDAIKRTRGDKGELGRVQILIDDRAGRVDVRTEHEQNRTDRNRGDHVSVDYTVTVPASVSVDVHSVSGAVKVTGVHGSLRAETVSGDVTINDAPRLEAAKTVSGDVSLTGVTADGDLSAASVSGNVRAKGLKARGLDLGSVSGDISVTDVTCERLGVKTVSGGVEYAGGIAKGGRYEINAHSGTVRLQLTNPAGFELTANSFSGSIRSELPLTIGGDAGRQRDSGSRGRRDSMNNHAMRATFGDGSATLVVRTFSGDIIITKR
ncbi:MAG TPA: DUF4097 family beta strand repeat-containing protein [Vicinamibacterales bacterium]|jgi:DUF4097 and DUF4098 domain-containing protein YvlB|nr:DUF4097 family beta strand repeat-containing protein [Vicinamibacterales bacterium]